MLSFLFYLNLSTKVDTLVSPIYFDSKYPVKYKVELMSIQIVTINNVLPFKDVQTCQYCQHDSNTRTCSSHV